MRWIYTTEKEWIDKWNNLILKDINSCFLQSTYWLSSYSKYGFEWELLLCIDGTNNILLGSANLIVQYYWLKFYVCSYGPTISEDIQNDSFNEFFDEFVKRSKVHHAIASQLTYPDSFCINRKNIIEGRIVPHITIQESSNLISLKDLDGNKLSQEEIIKSFLPKGRRDVRASLRKGLVSKMPINYEEIKSAYLCFEMNAENKNYYVRKWEDMGEIIYESIKNEMAYIITAWYGDEIQGAILLERSSNQLNYTLGGVKRHKPDLLTGYFLQMEAMLLASELNMDFYNITHGGPLEVQHFKDSFNPHLVKKGITVNIIHKRMLYVIFIWIYNSIKSFIPQIVKMRRYFYK